MATETRTERAQAPWTRMRLADLQGSVGGQVLTTGDPMYTHRVALWNGMIER